jgi:predicted transposase/invertase (TIGR01784 family)
MTDIRQERYINPYTDFGFKKLFGTEMNKDLLISFLNALFTDSDREIVDVQYLNSEHLGDSYGDRRAVFDVYCKTVDGGRFIVEMQRAHQDYFKDRSLYYSTFAIREQAPKDKNWNYQLEDVYTIGVLDFTFPDDEYPADKYIHQVKLKDVDDNHVFYDKLTLIYIEMPKFNKTEDELVTMTDKWMYALRNLSRLLERPKALQDRVFKKLFEQAEIARYNPEERREYVLSVKNYWDYYSTVKSALNKGRAEGRAEGMKKANVDNARKMKAKGFSASDIAEITGLATDEIAEL